MRASSNVLLTWQRTVSGEENLLSPQIERLIALHRSAYATDRGSGRIAALIDGQVDVVNRDTLKPHVRPAATAEAIYAF